MPFVIGLVGEKGSGKGTFVELFRSMAAPADVIGVRYSDVLRETLALWDIPSTRPNLQDLAAIMVQRYGADALAHAIEERIKRTDADIVILDGIRREAEVALLQKFQHYLLVYVTADPKTRYERLRLRGENAGERQTTLEQFMSEERAINETLIPQIGARAAVRITNNGTPDEFKERVRGVVASVRGLMTAVASRE